jgi:5'-nucleotidase (lipoprotein e(P4) family)
MRKIILVFLSLLMMAGCANQPTKETASTNGGEKTSSTTMVAPSLMTRPALAEPFEYIRNGTLGTESLHAVLYQQTATEYSANTMQAYQVAAMRLQQAMRDQKWTAATEQVNDPLVAKKPLAVIVDVDETVLDNSPYQARLLATNADHSEAAFTTWCNEAAARAIPGAVAFSQFVHAQKAHGRPVAIWYVSNRDVSLAEITRQNLNALGFADTDDLSHFMFKDKAGGFDTKGSRRAEIAKKFRIALLVGDNLGDFIEGYKTDNAARRMLIAPYQKFWGERWIILPNAMYGSWEETLSGFDRSKTTADKRQTKLKLLDLVGAPTSMLKH